MSPRARPCPWPCLPGLEKGTPLTSPYLTLLDKVGAPAERPGHSIGHLEGLGGLGRMRLSSRQDPSLRPRELGLSKGSTT